MRRYWKGYILLSLALAALIAYAMPAALGQEIEQQHHFYFAAYGLLAFTYFYNRFLRKKPVEAWDKPRQGWVRFLFEVTYERGTFDPEEEICVAHFTADGTKAEALSYLEVKVNKRLKLVAEDGDRVSEQWELLCKVEHSPELPLYSKDISVCRFSQQVGLPLPNPGDIKLGLVEKQVMSEEEARKLG